MTRQLLPIVGFGLLATLAAVVALVAAPDRRDLIVDLYVLSLGGIAVLRLVGLTKRGLASGERSEFDDALRPGRFESVRVAERDKLEREIELGLQTAFDFHFRVRPTLVEIARNRLAGRGISLDDERRARGALGAEAWEVLRPDRGPPHERNAPSLSTDELGGLVTALEKI